MSTVRLRRLQSDYEKVRDYVNRHPRLQLIQADGSPPERYQLEYRIRGDGCFLTCAYTRHVHPPWGQAGGLDGSPNFVEVVRASGAVERHAVVTTLPVDGGDVIRIHTGNGGGYGNPSERARERVLDDLRNGHVSRTAAAAIYALEG